MSVIVREAEADLGVLDGRRVAVVGYGNQGRSWALNLLGPRRVGVRARRRDPRRG